jgi:acyl-CoA synthetase (AMP-forming)/AMP-acid ligase II
MPLPTTRLPRTRPEDGPLGSLARFDGIPALVTPGSSLSYADLADRVRERTADLGSTRRLVLLECRNDIETVVTYLAALEGRHPVLLAGLDCLRDDLVATYRPDVVASGSRLDVHGRATGHDLHPELALLLSTSGSTGSPKLVRLSRNSIRSNAESIAKYLQLTTDDRAATTLPMHYCYGLSVVNSHLLVGASLLVTQASVVEDQFWTDFADAGATSFAGVPHVFDLLDSSGFADRDLPSLRTVTQAGGRLEPETVRRYALLGRKRGFDLVVMYGQTEATARMAYLPPHLAAERPESIGIPIPGGTFRIDGDDEVGELVYAGDNVMLGYATGLQDLALGRTVHELRTGDLARQHEDGLFELVGRTSRFAKLFGMRVDLDRVENLAVHDGGRARVVEYDGRLHVFVMAHSDLATVRRLGRRLGLPDHALVIHVLAHEPVTPSGKPDYGALLRHAGAAAEASTAAPRGPLTPERIRNLYAHMLGRPDATEDDSFVTLRGDSLSYVEASVRLGQLLEELPRDWPQLSARQLAGGAPQARALGRWWAPVETSVVLRAAAIVLIVGSHSNLLSVMGGAHVLLAVVGFNLARFQLASRPRTERRRGLLRSARNVALPSALWIAGAGLMTGMYDASTALMLNNFLGSATWDVRWQFWFLEVVVWTMLTLGLLVSVPALDRLERTHRFVVAAIVFAASLATRYALVGVEAGPSERYALPVVLWCLALGWMAARARTPTQRVITSMSAVFACWGYFDDPVREALVAAGVCALVWAPYLRVPATLLPAVSVLAASSLFVYLTHWQVYPHLEMDHPVWATVASFAVGIAVWRGYGWLLAATAARWRSAGRRRGGSSPLRRVPAVGGRPGPRARWSGGSSSCG